MRIVEKPPERCQPLPLRFACSRETGHARKYFVIWACACGRFTAGPVPPEQRGSLARLKSEMLEHLGGAWPDETRRAV